MVQISSAKPGEESEEVLEGEVCGVRSRDQLIEKNQGLQHKLVALSQNPTQRAAAVDSLARLYLSASL